MEPEHHMAFGPFRLEVTPGRLWRGDQVIPLRPRSLAMLCYLVAHPGRLVTKTEVRQQVWAGTHVSDSVLRALEGLTADRALVLVLEDLQWSDPSTVECLAYLAQRPEPARLLVLGTYRPVEVLLQGHPLRGTVQELCGRGQAVDLRLEFLSAADVAAYVAGRLGGPVAAPLTFVND